MLRNQSAPSTALPPEPQGPGSNRPRDYYKRFAEAFYHDFVRNGPPILFNNRDEYAENRLYSLGQQNVDLYKKQVGVTENGPSYVQLDWTILPIWPKFRDIIVSKMNARVYRPEARALDETSLRKEREFKHRQQARILLKDTAAQLQGMGVPIPESDPLPEGVTAQLPLGEPQTEQELDLFMQVNYKTHIAIAAESGARVVAWQNDLPEIRRQVQRDILDCGLGIIRDWVDRRSGLISLRRCDPANCISGLTIRGDFRYVTRFGELTPMTAADILAQAAEGDFTPRQKENVRELARGGVRSGWAGSGSTLLESMRQRGYLLVLDCEWLGSDELELPGAAADQAADTVPLETLYQCKWVVGTDLVFDYGPARDQKRSPRSPRQSALTFSAVATELDSEMRNLPYTSRVKPIADDLQLTRLKIQQLVAAARPKGLMIQVEALQGVTAGDGQEELQPLEVVGIYDQTGSVLYSGLDVAGDPSRALPIKELENGLAADTFKLVDIYNFHIDHLRTVTGLNEASDASAPAPGQLNGTTQASLMATNLALEPLMVTEQVLLSKVTRAIVTRFQHRFRDYQQRAGDYRESIGEHALKVLADSQDFDLAEIGISLEMTDSPEETQFFEAMVQAALTSRLQTGQGGIDLEDALLLRRIAKESGVKLAEQYLLFRQRLRKEDDLRQAQMQAQMNSQQQQESAQMAAQLEQQKLEQQAGIEINKIRAIEEEKRKTLGVKHGYDMDKLDHVAISRAQIEDLKGDIALEILNEQIELTDARVDRKTRNLDDGAEQRPTVPEAA